MRVVSDGLDGGILRFDHPAVGVAGEGTNPQFTAAVFPTGRRADSINTGVAIRNLKQASIEVSCQLMQAGSTLETNGVESAGNGRSAKFSDEMFTRSGTSDFVGSVRCAAFQGKRFTGIALEMDAGSQIFTTRRRKAFLKPDSDTPRAVRMSLPGNGRVLDIHTEVAVEDEKVEHVTESSHNAAGDHAWIR